MTNEQIMADAQTLWDYHQLDHELRPTDIAIGLGSHDIGVAEHAADLYHRGLFPLIVFTGANAPTTVDIFPRGEATHFTERAIELGVPLKAILQEAEAKNTGENFTLVRSLLDRQGLRPKSATLISRPYQQRRAYATVRKLWPELGVSCSSRPQSLECYIESIGDSHKVLNMLVGDTQRIWKYADAGFAIAQPIDCGTLQAYEHLVSHGFTKRLLP
ncbi:YdcF family protein [Brachybacterium saurashtrense]|uniref:YdcF family protein n=1 Tax=Brachybacterium saurashtrense TaxID=556288 RepID=A0A345YPL3_9MICO|nr:YdcF family protein [Brachybacterium saurashtrense]AXK45865.1 YdcF family protein [Brachybacterium saurashtrense]RRR24884.1 YdcF family protein [Brachybacterium saurashtrense]